LPRKAIEDLRLANRFVLSNPRKDYFKIRRVWIELELENGRKCSSQVATSIFSQPPDWRYAEGVCVTFGKDIEVLVRF